MNQRLLLSAALLLSACGTAPPTSPAGSTGRAVFQLLSLPAEVQQATLEVRGTDAATSRERYTLTATIQGGRATFTVPNLVRGAYTLTARGYDGADAAKVVLYKGVRNVTFQNEEPVSLRMNRVTSAVVVTATGVAAKSNVLVARAGALEARLIAGGTSATGSLQGVPTGRAVQVVVEGRSSDGTLAQQGTVTLRLSEEDQTLSVPLKDVVNASAPETPTLSAADAVKPGEAYALNITAGQDGTAQLQRVTVDWGDGSVPTVLDVSGQSAQLQPTHTYTAAGTRNVSVTVTNTAGLSSTAGLSVTVLDTTTGNVTVDVGADVAPVTLTFSGVEAGAERVTATVTAPAASLGGQSVRGQDLQQTYTLELVPRGGGVWSGTLSLPVGYEYAVQPRVLTASGEPVREGQPRSFSTQAGGTAAAFTFGAGGGAATCPTSATVTNIGAVQGAGAASPLAGQTVTVRGVVTGDFQAGLGGFYIQEIAPDGDPATSDGLFVYTNTAAQSVQAGDIVQVGGKVSEFYNSTQLEAVTLFEKCSGTEVVKPVTLTFPLNSTDQLEQYENMLVTVPQTLTVTDNYGYGRYGELGLSSGGRLFNPTNGNVAGETAATQALRRLVLDDGRSNQNPDTLPFLSPANTRRTGDTVQNLTGVLRYANSAYKLEPTVTPNFSEANPRLAAPKEVGGRLRVAGANVLNYFTTFGGSTDRGATSAYEFGRQQAKIVSELLGLNADVVTLMEVQNNGDTALNDLVGALNAAAGTGTYAAVETGAVGTDAIKVGIIYKPASVTPVGQPLTDPAAINDRPPVAQTFREVGTNEVFSVIANHFKSKGSCPKTGDTDQGQGCWNLKRVQQAQELLTFADQVRQASGDPDVLLLGDLNSYGAEDPIQALVAGGYESLNKRIPAEDRYSYQYGGQFGYLDHALSSASLSSQVTGITEWHINADEPVFLDYNVEFKNNPTCTSASCTTPDLYQPDAFRSSDHDPVLVGLNLQGGAGGTPGGTPQPGGELYFSEYVEGSSNNKALELYNPGPEAVDLASYTVELYANGATTTTNSVALSGTLAAGGTFVIVNGSAVQALKDRGQLVSNVTNFNGNDVAVLKKKGAVLDVIGQLGSAANFGVDVTLRRKASVTAGDPDGSDAFDPAAQWDAFPIDTFGGLGSR